ncbi:DUF3047 domain-containing protein [Methylosinus sp. H3A]|uniref:DUF3047 domain-containing protein n=1 Tax=Methylosinus sp. H3A TaxID=2785786 RepID=UPI0018C1E7D5|nr:DUF3047 domain-containing protein [Methylosinus sp. H3A]MBG0808039.1 DUF3047 domain-containing protein [Methylosinus sp. H3A]
MRNETSGAALRLLCCLSILVLVPAARAQNVLVDPAEMLGTAKRIDFVGRNDFSVEQTAQGAVLRSVPHRSASGLYKPVEMNGRELTQINWRWRVDRLHEAADVRRLQTEDFGAMVMFVFGHPSLMNRDVPTLGYVWTSTPVRNETFLHSQRYGALAYVQLRGRGDVGRLREEIRDVAADFRAVFGTEPGALKYIAVFNDNDQTNEPASAVFGPILDLRKKAGGR